MISFRNNFSKPYVRNWVWFMLYTSFFSAIENEILHSSSTCFPSLWPMATRWHPDFMMSSTTSGEGHAWHLLTQEDAIGGQKSLKRQWAWSYSVLQIQPLLHGPCIIKFLREHVEFLYFSLETHRIPLIFTQGVADSSDRSVSSKGNKSIVNPGGLSELSDNIIPYRSVL